MTPERGAGYGEHLVAMPGSDWRVWRDAVLRTTGFAADGLGRLSAPDCARVADAHLAGGTPVAAVRDALAAALRDGAREVHAIASDPLLREAMAWQNRSMLSALDGIAKAGPEPDRKSKHRYRERIVVRYWQRYCGKTETIGFFGPVCWGTVDPSEPVARLSPGPALVRDRRVFLEHWALASYASLLSADPLVREWLPPVLQPQLSLNGAAVLDLTREFPVSQAERAVLAWCDGRRAARDVAAAVLGAPGSRFRKEEDVYLVLGALAERGLLRWTLDLPVSQRAERILAERVAAIGDPRVRDRAAAGLAELLAGRDTIAAAAGNPERLADALGAADASFTRLTRVAALHGQGTMYAARTICAEDTTRDLDVVFGAGILAALAAPLTLLLQAARWVSVAMADAYLAELRALYEDLARELGTGDVPLGQLWFLAQGLFYGAGPRPADPVFAELGKRLRVLYGLPPDGASGAGRLTLRSAELAARVTELFPAVAPGWAQARVHAPDFMIGAAGPAALCRGEFTAVLGELHVALPTCASTLFVNGHPDPARLRAAWAADVGPDQVQLLVPVSWPRNTVRLQNELAAPGEAQLGFTPAPGADPDRLLPVTAMTVTERAGTLVAATPDGRVWPLLELFGRSLSEVSVDAFKIAAGGTGAHSPRITIDRLVVARETWRLTAGSAIDAFAGRLDDLERYVAVRRWRRALGLPEHVYLTMGTETKPVFADLTSPFYVDSVAAMLRAARLDGGDQVPVIVTEMLPGPGEAWVPDAAGGRYFGELRLHAVDPERAR